MPPKVYGPPPIFGGTKVELPRVVLAPSEAAAKAWMRLRGDEGQWELVTSGPELARWCVASGPFRFELLKLHGWETAADEALRQVVAAIDGLREQAVRGEMEAQKREREERLGRCERMRWPHPARIGEVVRRATAPDLLESFSVVDCQPDGAGGYDLWVEKQPDWSDLARVWGNNYHPAISRPTVRTERHRWIMDLLQAGHISHKDAADALSKEVF